MSNEPQDLFQFGPFRFDLRRPRLTRNGEVVALTPKALEVLGVRRDGLDSLQGPTSRVVAEGKSASAPERGGVPRDVICHESRDEVIAVIVTGMHPQFVLLA